MKWQVVTYARKLAPGITPYEVIQRSTYPWRWLAQLFRGRAADVVRVDNSFYFARTEIIPITKPSQAASEERARIVAWLRTPEAGGIAFATDGSFALADAIERGEHDYVGLPRMKLGSGDEAP